MVIFIDESGTHKQADHATEVIVYVAIKNLEQIQKQICGILQDLNLEAFHWADQGWVVREKFFNKIIKLKFTFKVAIFKNPVSGSKMIDIIFQCLITENNIKSIYIDGKKPKWYEHRLKKVLRDRGISIKNLRTIRSKSNVGIQLADALAGLTRYHFDNPKELDAGKLFRRLDKEHKIIDQIFFDKEAVKRSLKTPL
ncbi:MAG: DUF3800 domain-containing protein [Candidatus Daviesbacteria bacterium]|nr:DUF3800 domain-containing protein [Candidatus Daviesbacteria bacterium]